MAMFDRLLPIGETGKRLGLPRRWMDARISDGTITTFVSDRDRRVKLVNIDDVTRLLAPRPTKEREDAPLTAA